MWTANGLSGPSPMVQPVVVSFLASLRLASLTPWICPQTFHFPGLSSFLVSPLHLQLHTASCIALLLAHCLLLKSGWKLFWPYNSFIFHVLKTSTKWLTPKTAASWNASQISFSLECMGGVPRLLSARNAVHRNKFPRSPPFLNMIHWDSLVKVISLV